MKSTIVIKPKGQVTLPAEFRSKYGLETGDVMSIEDKDGKFVLSPAVVVEIEMYSDEDIARWAKEDEWKPGEKELWKKRWGLKKL